MSKLQLISDWEAWKNLCYSYDEDPYEIIEFGIDMGGGNSESWEYVGEHPKCEHGQRVVVSQDGFNLLYCPDCEKEWHDEDI